mmetsp:Transcript_26607/g.84415  ORF Transcript_26607/g.84415 Transcript_26607/m.84415 type:complete len:129 (-) Transcript_26607:39-425(-)
MEAMEVHGEEEWDPAALYSMFVELGDSLEEVVVHPHGGPLVYMLDGSYGFLKQHAKWWGPRNDHGIRSTRAWTGMTATERLVHLHQAAKKNKSMREFKGADFFKNAKLPSQETIEQVQRRMGMLPQRG